MFQFKHIHKQFGQRLIAQDINLTVRDGDILTILGESGSGKTTLLHMAAGLQKVDSGEIWLNGENITFRQPEKRQMAMMFQDFALLPHLNVWENVAFGLKLRGVSRANRQKKALKILTEIGLSHATERAIGQLSGGEQQRVALARALVVSPQLLLLDEPFSSLDSSLRQQLQQQICQLVQQKNIPTILVSHDPAEAALMSQQIALLVDGKIIQCGTPSELFTRPVSAQAARLLGCLNVSEKYFISPQIIDFSEQGELCTIKNCFRQPANWRVTLLHPHWGELVAFSQHDMVRQTCRVKIDAQKVVSFQAA